MISQDMKSPRAGGRTAVPNYQQPWIQLTKIESVTHDTGIVTVNQAAG